MPALTLISLFGLCVGSLPWTASRYTTSDLHAARTPPGRNFVFGSDLIGRSLAARTMLGGAVSLGLGIAAAAVSVVVGVTYGLTAAWFGGRVEAVMMRIVDVLYGLPYILLAILMKVGLDALLLGRLGFSHTAANLVVLIAAISAVSWLTMARVIRGQVLSLKSQPFIEAARALGLPGWRIAWRHLLPNLSGPIIVYASLTVPQAILQESFLSFLGIGIERPLPSWGNLAADGVSAINNVESFWWLLLFPCGLLTLSLLCLSALGDRLRDRFDPRAAN